MTKFDDDLNALDEVMRTRLKKLVEESGLSLRTIEKEAKARGFNGLSANNLSRYTKKGGVKLSRASISTLFEIAAFFNKPPEYIMGFFDEDKAGMFRLKLGLDKIDSVDFRYETQELADIDAGFKGEKGLEKFGISEGDLVFYRRYIDFNDATIDIAQHLNNVVLVQTSTDSAAGFRRAFISDVDSDIYFLSEFDNLIYKRKPDEIIMGRITSLIRKFK